MELDTLSVSSLLCYTSPDASDSVNTPVRDLDQNGTYDPLVHGPILYPLSIKPTRAVCLLLVLISGRGSNYQKGKEAINPI